MQREDNVGCFIYSSAAGGSRHKENHSPCGITDTDHRLYDDRFSALDYNMLTIELLIRYVLLFLLTAPLRSWTRMTTQPHCFLLQGNPSLDQLRADCQILIDSADSANDAEHLETVAVFIMDHCEVLVTVEKEGELVFGYDGPHVGIFHTMLQEIDDECLSRGTGGSMYVGFGLPGEKLRYVVTMTLSGDRLTAEEVFKRGYPLHHCPSFQLVDGN